MKFYIFAGNINDLPLMVEEMVCDVCDFRLVDSYFTPECIAMIKKHLLKLHAECFDPVAPVHNEIFVMTEHEYKTELDYFTGDEE